MTASPRAADRRAGRLVAAALAAFLLSGEAQAQDSGNPVLNFFKYGGTTKPPEAPANVEEVYCPVPDVAEGAASIQVTGGGALRSQISLGQVSRDCAPGPGGTTLVRVGVQGRALLGPGGSPGRYEAPVTITIKHGTEIVTRRARRGAAIIAPGTASATFAVVEEGLSVPAAYARDFDIEVGLGGAAAKPARAQRRKPAAPAASATAGGQPD